MEKLEQKHINFLRTCAEKANKIHNVPEGVSIEDADAMAAEGLLIRYNRIPAPMYCIARYGTQFVKEFGASDTPEMRKLAVAYVMTKGYEEEAADKIVTENGVAVILDTQAQEMRKGTQREVQAPTDANGNVDLKFKQSFK